MVCSFKSQYFVTEFCENLICMWYMLVIWGVTDFVGGVALILLQPIWGTLCSTVYVIEYCSRRLQRGGVINLVCVLALNFGSFPSS